ncbi:class D sortase [Oceanobacillus halophilus]|uniref:Class D sortase n=1 Tax=Oceanobacillus halophilus TaxID=930130 RepID=A0A495A773_9BACI|nr:class D sortase [Oceanobacillus halophilus]RKQ35589.1 class D sortase [Oceanobacillus halophilus]
MKKLAILLILAGVIILGIGSYQWITTENAQKNSLIEAKELLKETPHKEKDVHNQKTGDFLPQTGETSGILHIPKLKSDLPIIEGTDEDELDKGVGHYKGTAYPTQGEQIVLSGHRDTVFRRMGELELGDILTLELPYGDFSYEIVETQIVDADDRTIIKPQGKEVLTLTTCYPFSFVGSAPDRYIITALPVEDK